MSRSTATAKPILPGAVLGVLGGGQLGRMFAIAARRMGYRVHTLSPEDDTPTGQVADREIRADYEDLDAIRAFARDVSVVTFEFENVPAATGAAAASFVPVRPAGEVLHITQNRLREKTWLQAHGFPVTPFGPSDPWNSSKQRRPLLDCPRSSRLPALVTTVRGSNITHPGELAEAWQDIRQDAVLEKMVDFEAECSVVAARGLDGTYADFGLIRNDHARHILDVSVSPSGFAPGVEQQAREIARGVLEQLNVVGVLCVEFFLTRDQTLLVNELAPRPHNSGHLTFDACLTSQFEQQVRAICGLPLGDTTLLKPAAMANLLGDIWDEAGGEPDWSAALAYPNVKLHLYGKHAPRRGRKMGHLTALADSPDQALRTVTSARRTLLRQG